MTNGDLQPADPPAAMEWDKNLIFYILADPVRRELLAALARSGPKAAAELKVGKVRFDAMLKHLIVLREAGLVNKKKDPRNGKRSLYELSPRVRVTNTPNGPVFDFNFLSAQL